MSFYSRKQGIANRQNVEDILEQVQLGIDAFECRRGFRPAAVIMDYDMLQRTLCHEHIVLKPGHIIEFDGVRVLSTPDLNGKVYLAEHLHEVPEAIFLREG